MILQANKHGQVFMYIPKPIVAGLGLEKGNRVSLTILDSKSFRIRKMEPQEAPDKKGEKKPVPQSNEERVLTPVGVSQ